MKSRITLITLLLAFVTLSSITYASTSTLDSLYANESDETKDMNPSLTLTLDNDLRVDLGESLKNDDLTVVGTFTDTLNISSGADFIPAIIDVDYNIVSLLEGDAHPFPNFGRTNGKFAIQMKSNSIPENIDTQNYYIGLAYKKKDSSTWEVIKGNGETTDKVALAIAPQQ